MGILKVVSTWAKSPGKHFGAVFSVVCAIHCIGFFILMLVGATTIAVQLDNPIIHAWFFGVGCFFIGWELLGWFNLKDEKEKIDSKGIIPTLVMLLGLAIILISMMSENAHAHSHDRPHIEEAQHHEALSQSHNAAHAAFMLGNIVIFTGHRLHRRRCRCKH